MTFNTKVVIHVTTYLKISNNSKMAPTDKFKKNLHPNHIKAKFLHVSKHRVIFALKYANVASLLVAFGDVKD